jgi:hypothetical protein
VVLQPEDEWAESKRLMGTLAFQEDGSPPVFPFSKYSFADL